MLIGATGPMVRHCPIATGGIGPEDAAAITYMQATLWQGGTVGAPGTLSGNPPPPGRPGLADHLD